MTDVSIIGAGRLGTSLGHALRKKGYKIKALSCRTVSSAQKSRKIIGEGIASIDNIQTAKMGQIVFLCLPDEEISKVAKVLAGSNINWSKKFVFHCSGLIPSKVLKPLGDKGAFTASLHPIQSFAQKKTPSAQFENIYFGLEGSTEALALSSKIVRQLGGHPLFIQPEDKALYHAACSTASNFFVVLLEMAVSLLKKVDLQEEKALQILLPLVKGTLHNVKKLNIRTSLTGPVIRGDEESLQEHLNALRNFPFYYETYKRLAAQAMEIAKKEGKISPQKIKALKKLMEGK
jgi:predicted short-subunit dehydrogenase-like oxidoreductase (DUF2520 family)